MAGVNFIFGCLRFLRSGDIIVSVAEDMSADLSPDVAVGGLRGEIHHFLRQDIGAVDRSFNGLVLRLEGFRLVQTGHGTELSLPVDHVMEVIREAVGGDPVQRHLRDGLLTLSYSVSAWGTMHALGAERIVIWRQMDETSWVEALRYDETTAALWTPDGQHHSGQVRYQGWPATAYRVEVTLFAENDQGRDSRTWSKELRP